jgi:hypothetical protein
VHCDKEMVIDHLAPSSSSLNLSSLDPHLSGSVQSSRKCKIADQDDNIEDDARKCQWRINGGLFCGNSNEEQHGGHNLEDIGSLEDNTEAGDNKHGAATEGKWGDDEGECEEDKDLEECDYDQEEDGDDCEDAASSDNPYDVEDVLEHREQVGFLQLSYVILADVCLTSICLV